jgi:DNA-binding NarL/FixJ family response regulator
MSTELPIGVAAVNDYELVVDGLAALLARFPDRLAVRDKIIIGETIDVPVDVALYDTYGRIDVTEALRELRTCPEVRKIAVFTIDVVPELVEQVRRAGADGVISKRLTGDEIADAIVRVAAGEFVQAVGTSSNPSVEQLRWPGKDDGVTERESEVLVLAAQGLTNREIADALYIGVETVKSHLRNVYAKLGIRNRVEASTYVHEHATTFASTIAARRPAVTDPGA